MRRTDLYSFAPDSSPEHWFGSGNPAALPMPIDPPITAHLSGDFLESPLANWEVAWIDLGGEG